MSVRVHKVVSKVELSDFGGRRLVKAEIHPNNGWVLVDGAWNMTIVQRFRAQCCVGDHAITHWEPDDAIRVLVERGTDGIEISLDREEGGAWFHQSEIPRLVVGFDSVTVGDRRKIRVSIKGGDLKEPIQIGEVPLFPPAKPRT